MKKLYSFVALLLFVYANITAQSTYQQVYAIFQAKCTGACHAGALPSGNLDLSGPEDSVYLRLVNAAPVNPAAVTAGYKRVSPGYPFRSFLMKKVNHGLDPQNDLLPLEGNTMPMTYPADTLAIEQIELIRQWIIWGAKDTGTAYNSALIHDYYNGSGVEETTAPLTPAQEGREGYQLKFGPVFLQPQGEFEYFQVYDPKLPASVEVTEMHAKLPPNSHHWVLRTISQAGATAMGVAPQEGANFNTQIQVFQYSKFKGIWQFSDDLILPAGTAHYQQQNEQLLLNLHMHNYSSTQILGCSAYMNVYTQPMGSGAVEMKTDLSSYGGQNPFALQIPPTGQPYTVQNPYTAPGETRYFWNIQSHTHQWGKDFDMFLRNSDGTKGAQFYEGFYNEDYSFNQGYYDYAHPAVKTFDPLMAVNMDNGMIFEATYQNNTAATIPFSLTTQGEMFVTYFQYTNELPATAVNNVTENSAALQVYPNPSKDIFNLSYTTDGNKDVTVDLYNSVGAKMKTLFNGLQINGKHTMHISTSEENLAAGIYFIHLNISGNLTISKIVVMNR